MKGLFGDEISQDFFTKKYLMCVKETVKRRRKFFTKKSTSEIKQNLYWDMTAILIYTFSCTDSRKIYNIKIATIKTYNTLYY